MRAPVVVPLLLALILYCQLPCRAEDDWWGHRLPGAPSHFIFGYGSLINSASRSATAGTPVHAIPVRVSARFGFVRTWNDRSPSGFTALGLRRPRDGEAGATVNGVLYAVEGDDMAKFDEREHGYVRVEIAHELIEALSWERLPESGHIWVYVPVRDGGTPGEGLPEADPDHPLLESYIDVVVEGALEYGSDYARELIETTRDWSACWLDDRALARRPWVHDARSAAVDRLLSTVQPAAAHLADRAFPERFAARWLVPAAR